MIKGIIFDLDGTLIDSMGMWTTVDKAFLLENGIANPPSDISDKMRKMSVEESTSYFIEEFGLSCTKEYVIKRIEELVSVQYREKIQLKPGVLKLLDYLDKKQLPYGIATATYKNLAEAVLNHHGILERFRFLFTDFEYPEGKNSPSIFLAAAERLGIKPAEILVAEDSLHCIETAAAAGFCTAGIYGEVSGSEWDKINLIADMTFKSIDELINIL